MEVTTSMEIAAAPEAVGARLLDFGGIARWHPGLVNVTVEGSGVGSIRTYQLSDARFVERLDAIDDDGRGMGYAVLESPFQLVDYRARYSLVDASGATTVLWLAEFQAPMPQLAKPMGKAVVLMQEAALRLLKISLEQRLDLTAS